jgi:hypothetical protein
LLSGTVTTMISPLSPSPVKIPAGCPWGGGINVRVASVHGVVSTLPDIGVKTISVMTMVAESVGISDRCRVLSEVCAEVKTGHGSRPRVEAVPGSKGW